MKNLLAHSLILATLFIILLCFITPASSESHAEHEAKELARILKEYDIKKQTQFREKFCVNQYKVNHHLPYHRICPDFNRNHLKLFLSLFLIIAIGAVLRTFLRLFELNLPYTVILMIFGILIGFVTQNEKACVDWSKYTRLARTNPKVILFIFLPVLIFESAFAMKAHVFYRSSVSITILALPGMLIATFVTAFICMQFFFAYKWDFMVSSLYGSIISATDPVAVVAILKEIGTSETLSIMIEGESLLNDGVAILLYEIFFDIVKPKAEDEEGVSGLKIFLMFVRIAIGGPVFGWVMAKLAITFLSRIFNDAAVEVSITLVAAYLTYYIGEAFLGVSGVMAVVALGIVMSAERTCISPEVQGLNHHFWEMLGYLGNTVLFVMVGIVISETAINTVTLEDGYYLIFLYFALNIARFLMIIMLSPILSHVGYGLSWQNMMVMTWGGLRGAVGICLALEVYKDIDLCDRTEIGPKFLLQTAGIVLLTLLINGTTTKTLLDMLKLTELSVGKIQDMANAVKQIQSAQERTIAVMKHDRFLADCNWEILVGYTSIENPYLKHNVKAKKASKEDLKVSPSLVVEGSDDRIAICPACEGEVQTEPNNDEYREMTEEARLRLLKAMKVSCWRQFEQGVLTEEAVQILVDYLETCEDKRFQMFHAKDLKRYWEVRGIGATLRNKLLPFTQGQQTEEDLPLEPDTWWRKKIYKIVLSDWFDGFLNLLIFLNMIPIIWETVYIIQIHEFTEKEIIAFLLTNIAFILAYMLEFTLKVLGLGCGNYWSSKWNMLDALVLAVSIVEVSLSITYVAQGNSTYGEKSAETDFLKFLRFVRLLRIARMLRLFRPFVPRLMNYLNSKVNVLLFLGYDVAKGAATAIEDVVKFLPQMIENTKVLTRFKVVMEEQRLVLLLEMGLLQMDHPGIAIAVKTRHASRSILNQMREALNELKEDGLVDEKEYDILLHIVESKMKRLWESPSYMPPRRPEMLLADLQWVAGNADLLSYLLKQATLLHFAVGDTIYNVGDRPNGIYIIVSGVVKIYYQPSFEFVQAREETGEIPNMEICYEPNFETEMTDYYASGGVLGELGVVTGTRRAATVTCETGVVVYHLSQSTMQKAMESFDDHYDSLEGRLWRACGMKLASAVLPTESTFQAWTMDKIKTHLELSAVPIGEQYLTMTIPDFISDVVLIYGQCTNFQNSEEVYTAPCLIPHTVTKIKLKEGWHLRPHVLVIASEEMEHFEEPTNLETTSPSFDDIHKCVMARTRRASIDEEQVGQMRRPSMTVSFGVRRRGSKTSVHSNRRAPSSTSVGSRRSNRRDQAPSSRSQTGDKKV